MLEFLQTWWPVGAAVAVSLGAGFWIGGKRRPREVKQFAAPVMNLPVTGQTVAAANYELFHEIGGEFVSTGEVFSEADISPHDAVMSRQALHGRSYAAKRLEV